MAGIPRFSSDVTAPDAAAALVEHGAIIIERLVDDALLRERLGAAAQIHALAQSGWDAYRERVAVVFSTLLGLS